MNLIEILGVVAAMHFLLFFFNTIFVTCMHYPYLSLLKNSGIEIQLLRIKWFTASFNRALMKWGLNRSKFWSMWFNTGFIVTLISLPVCILLILKMTLSLFISQKLSTETDKESPEMLQVMIPGLDMPYSQMGYYLISIVVCSLVHELGHAMAAVREDVRFFGIGMMFFFIIPITYISISDDQLSLLPIKNRLKILCAGVWHNVVLTGFAFLLMGVISFVVSPFFKINTGVFVMDIKDNSPLLGPTGLSKGDVIYKINDCSIKNISEWQYCISQASQSPTPGYCITDKMVTELDKPVQVAENSYNQLNCCDKYNRDKGYLCFQHLEGFTTQSLQAHFCLPARVILESSHSLCQNSNQCSLINDICVKPIVYNETKIVQIQRYGHKDVLFSGHPSEIFYSVTLSDWVPRFSLLTPYYPETLILFCKYLAIFSAGMALINIIPCFHFDGQFITTNLVEILLRTKIRNQSIRKITTASINSIFTLLLAVNLFYLYFKKL